MHTSLEGLLLLEEVLIWLPRNASVKLVTIEVDDDAEVLSPIPYRYSNPILYYGTSITESGCAMVSNGYTSLISRWLDVDFYNLGLSGSAVAELEMADYINSQILAGGAFGIGNGNIVTFIFTNIVVLGIIVKPSN